MNNKKLDQEGTVAEILFELQRHLSIPDYYFVGKNVELMISRAVGLTNTIGLINALSENDQVLMYAELNRMAMRTREYAEINDELIEEIAAIKSTANPQEYITNYLSIINKKKVA